MKFTASLSLISTALVVSLAWVAIDPAECTSVGDFIGGAKNYLVSLVRDGIVSKSALVTSFSETMEKIKGRYEQAKLNGELVGKDEVETSALYYKIVIDEIRILKEKIIAEGGAGAGAGVEGSETGDNKSVQDKFMDSLPTAKKFKPKFYDMMDMEIDMDDDEEELELMNELDDLENLEKGPEMGWGLNSESRAALQARTLQVLGDLVQNELKTLAMIIVTAYIGGPATGAIGPAMAAANVSIKFKLIEFFMQSVMDMFAACLGQKISPKMANPLAVQDPQAKLAMA